LNHAGHRGFVMLSSRSIVIGYRAEANSA
jgi:hypothetical protein